MPPLGDGMEGIQVIPGIGVEAATMMTNTQNATLIQPRVKSYFFVFLIFKVKTKKTQVIGN